MANSVDPDQAAPLGTVWSGSTLFAQTCLYENIEALRYVAWMDEMGFYVPFNSISVISGQLNGEHEGQMKPCLGLKRISPLDQLAKPTFRSHYAQTPFSSAPLPILSS